MMELDRVKACAEPMLRDMSAAVQRGFTPQEVFSATAYMLGVFMNKNGARIDFDGSVRDELTAFVQGHEQADNWDIRLRQ
jgi:hypothetical protein